MQIPKVCFGISASFADVAGVDPNGTRLLLANGVSTYSINGRLTLFNGPRKLSNLSY